MKKRKIYVVGGDFIYTNWMEGKLTQVMEEADLVLFTGGEDVSPSLYGEPQHYTSYISKRRDIREVEEFRKARMFNKHILGICRGSQFLCVMSGGKLVQDQSLQGHQHPIIVKGGRVLNITSTHHQAQFPFNLQDDEYEIIGWTNQLSRFHKDGNDMEMNPPKECEIVYYPETKCLGIQGHPEYPFEGREETIEYLRELLNNFLNDKL